MDIKNKLTAEKIKTYLRDKRVAAGIILFVFVTVMFAVSVNMRKEYKNYVSLDHHHHLTATSVVFTNNWLDDGIFHDHFAMMANPDSVEFPTLKDRSFYDSYPPGCIIPLYILAKLGFKKEITFGFVQRWDLFIQYITTMLLAFLVYLMFLKIGRKPYSGLIAAVIPTVINLFMPAPFYFFHSVYFADQAVLLPFMLTVFFEMLRTWSENEKTKKILAVCEGVFIFAGTFTDYLFPCLVLVIYLKRLILKQISFKSVLSWFTDSLKFAAPAILAVGLFALQIAVNGPVRIFDMFKFRTGMNDTTGWTEAFPRVFWGDHIAKGYGEHMGLVLKLSLAVVLAMTVIYFLMHIMNNYQNKKIVWLLSAAAMLIIPCFMQVYLLKNHSAIHDFSCLKFSLVISAVPFVLIPSAILEYITSNMKDEKTVSNIFAAVMTALAVTICFTTVSVHKANRKEYFPPVSDEPAAVGAFLRSSTDYNDIVFSEEYEIFDSNDYPAKLAFAKKRVYKADSAEAIYDKVRDLDADYIIDIFSYDGDVDGPLKGLVSKAYDKARDGDMYLYKISKDDFLSYINK